MRGWRRAWLVLRPGLAAAVIAVLALPAAAASGDALAQANAALQAGEADKALGLLSSLPSSGPGAAEGHNLACRVRLTLEQWDAAADECEQAVRLDSQNSDYSLWLGRAQGQKASRASFMTAFSLAKRTRAEFEEAVLLNPKNAEALSDLGDFYRQAPGVVGGGVDKAQQVAEKLDKISAARAAVLRGQIAEQQKDYAGAEEQYKKAVAADPRPAGEWVSLASFYARRKQLTEMETAIHSAVSAAQKDKHSSVPLFDAAGLLTENKRDPQLAATLLEQYLASATKSEEAPAFVAHLRLARLKLQLGDSAGAAKERAAALALAHDYKPAVEFKAE